MNPQVIESNQNKIDRMYRENAMDTENLWEQYLGNSVLPEMATAEEIRENVMRWTRDDIDAQDRITEKHGNTIAEILIQSRSGNTERP